MHKIRLHKTTNKRSKNKKIEQNLSKQVNMAIYHCSVKTISRSNGRSAVSSAAYRSGEKLYDERLDKNFYYPGKSSDIMYKEIMHPSNSPSWVSDREALWNNVELAEKRCDSQLAREIEISLPKEFNDAQNIALVREYIQKEFVSRGMIADICLHYGREDREPDNYNPHAHVMLTMREVSSSGFGLKNTEWNRRELLQVWRESFAELTNLHLSKNDFEIKVDHRSLADQGIKLLPQNVELPNDAKARLTDQLERQAAIMNENGLKLLANPEVALSAITYNQATFTDKNIERYVQSRSTSDEQFTEICNKIKNHKECILISTENGTNRYTTKEMLSLEASIYTKAANKSKEANFAATITGHKTLTLSPEQGAAVEYICQNKDLRLVIGHAGAGKTHMLSVAKEAWEECGYNIKGAALSGIAAENLANGSGITSKTVARYLLDWENNREKLTSKDIFVIDEASMLGTRDVAKIMQEAEKSGAKLIMLGDPKQLQAIEAGAAFRRLAETEGYLAMNDIRRQNQKWQKEATKCFAVGDIAGGLSYYEKANKVVSFGTKDQAMSAMISTWMSDKNLNTEKQIILTHTRSDVFALNNMARDALKSQGSLSPGIALNLSSGTKELSIDDVVYFLKNNSELGVKNGTLGRIIKIDESGNISVNIDSTKTKDQNNEISNIGNKDIKTSENNVLSFNLKDYNFLDYGYAATIHKAQGVTVDRTYVLATPGFDQRLTYVSMSRHKDEATMFWAKEDFKSDAFFKNSISRVAEKDNALDYMDYTTSIKTFAQQRGIISIYQDIVAQSEKLINEVGNIIKSGIKAVKNLVINSSETLSPNHVIPDHVIDDTKREFGKEVKTELTDITKDETKGRYRGTIECNGKEYLKIEQYDCVRLINSKLYKGQAQTRTPTQNQAQTQNKQQDREQTLSQGQNQSQYQSQNQGQDKLKDLKDGDYVKISKENNRENSPHKILSVSLDVERTQTIKTQAQAQAKEKEKEQMQAKESALEKPKISYERER